MKDLETIVSRRRMLAGALGLGALSLFTPGVFAEQLARTPDMTEGPFYPTHLPLDEYLWWCRTAQYRHTTRRSYKVWRSPLWTFARFAKAMSHQELNEAPDLDAGNPIELAGQYRDLRRRHPQLTVLGGCCGTDHRHLESISLACRTAA